MSPFIFTERAAAWAAVILSACGGVATTAIHYGRTQDEIRVVQQAQAATDARVAKHDDQLSAIQQQNAATAQSLSDIRDTVHEIQQEVTHHVRH